MNDKSVVQIEVISSPHQHGLYINGYRVAGGKPWAGGRTIEQWNVDIDYLRSAGFISTAEMQAREAAAYKRGQEDMRERAAQEIGPYSHEHIRVLPIKEAPHE